MDDDYAHDNALLAHKSDVLSQRISHDNEGAMGLCARGRQRIDRGRRHSHLGDDTQQSLVQTTTTCTKQGSGVQTMSRRVEAVADEDGSRRGEAVLARPRCCAGHCPHRRAMEATREAHSSTRCRGLPGAGRRGSAAAAGWPTTAAASRGHAGWEEGESRAGARQGKRAR
jgi:hypothetical protein